MEEGRGDRHSDSELSHGDSEEDDLNHLDFVLYNTYTCMYVVICNYRI